jgi:hypothetical protein
MGKTMRCNICDRRMDHLASDLYKCADCELVSSDVKPDLCLYDKSYLRKYERYANTEIGDKINAVRIEFSKRNIKTTGARLLDFGCGSGSFVDACILDGIDAYGFDINPYSRYCIIERLFKTYEVVTFWDSLEHISHPKEIIEGLRPGAVFISTPSTDDYKGEDLTKWHHYYPGEHVHYFNERALRRLFATCGYEVVDMSYEESTCRTSGRTKNILTIGGIR